MTGMKLPRVHLGRTGLEVTRFWLGCAPLGGVGAADAGEALLEAAWECGVRAFDTAPLYGLGLAERRLGAFLAGKPRDAFVLSTKVGRLLEPTCGQGEVRYPSEPNVSFRHDYSPDGVRRSLEESLERMGLDRADIVLIHEGGEQFETAAWLAYPALEELRSAGVVRAIGLGVNSVDVAEHFLRDSDIDCVLIAGRCSLLDDRAVGRLLPAAQERGIAVLVAGVFNSGILADPRPGATFDYEPAPAELLMRAQALRSVAASHGVSALRAAIQFPLRYPAVTAVVVGARSADEIQEDLQASGAPVPEALWADLKAAGLLGWHDPSSWRIGS